MKKTYQKPLAELYEIRLGNHILANSPQSETEEQLAKRRYFNDEE